ncbi:hypothetical protein KKE78_02720 [Patescibacteria group bacterium]|nr:hypothetical protein [Patescibacteria group bacterium]
MKKLILLAVTAAFLFVTSPVLAKGQGKDNDPGIWINYGNIRVEWMWSETNPWSGVDMGEGYYYTWRSDRDLDENYCEPSVTVNYGKFGGLLTKSEGCTDNFYWSDEPIIFTDKVIHQEETWVPGVTVPGNINHFVLKDINGDGEYTGGFNTVLFWDPLTKNYGGDYLFQQKFDYRYFVDEFGKVTHGNYMEYQYFTIPGTPGSPSGGQ